MQSPRAALDAPALLKHIHRAAKNISGELFQSRLEKIRVLEAELHQAEAADPLSVRELKRKWRRHILASFKVDAQVDSALRQGRTPLSMPKYGELSRQQWEQLDGPLHLRLLGKSFGIVGPILPYEVEAKTHLEVCYGSQSAKRGNLLLSCDAMWDPSVSFRHCGTHRFYSLLVVDADVPCEDMKQRLPLGLWAKLNQRLDHNSEASTFKAEGDDALACIAPHPARGSDTHRIIAVLISHAEPLALGDIIDEHRESVLRSVPAYKDRLIDLKLLATREGIVIEAYQFFRMCWTKETSKVFSRLGTR